MTDCRDYVGFAMDCADEPVVKRHQVSELPPHLKSQFPGATVGDTIVDGFGDYYEIVARPNSLPEDDAKRRQFPMADGLLDYFPNALAEVARISQHGSAKHNAGQPMHWARNKSTDHRNKMARHLIDAGGKDADGMRHSAYLAWRALANLQEELEREEGYPPSRASRFDGPEA